MAEFLAENNPCGQNLLRIVSIGNAIIAEILRLKDYIPEVFRLESKSDQHKYADIILDFEYLRISEAQDKKIENDPQLQDLDEQFRDNYLEILKRFYLAFESTHQYALDLKHFVHQLSEGHYIQQTLESVLQDDEGKQLLCESLYLFGVMLLVIDFHIPGILRERILMSYYRYSAAKSQGDSNIDDICMLLRSTGFSSIPNAKKIPKYPENYFGRFQFDQIFIDMVIGRLRSDDIYNQITLYPLPDHRSTAIANQAGMLYICLYFSPQILHNQVSQMREITDKFFSDNWIIPIYMGITVNLLDAWDNFRAAKSAIRSAVVEPNSLSQLCLKHNDNLKATLPKTINILQEGILTENYILQNIVSILHLIRDCNVTLRWLLLHINSNILEFGGISKKEKQILEYHLIECKSNNQQIFELLLNTSQLELIIKEILKELITNKDERWNNYKKECIDRVTELSETFSGERPLSKIEKNDELKSWFSEIAKEISNLLINKVNTSGRKIIQLIQTLERVQEFHNMQANMQIKQYIKETKEYLHRMIQLINIKEDISINIQLISDLSYAWHIIDRYYTQIMQTSIQQKPNVVIKLRAVFLKLSTALEIPLMRINQAKSEDLISVSQYYSNELANYIRKVVQIIPEKMFEKLAKIISLQTDVIKELPTRLEKDKLKEYSQLDERFKISKLTYSISVFTEGILMMKKTLVGVIELDPKKLLEDGIRKELVINLSKALHYGLIFNAKGDKTTDLEEKLKLLSKVIDGYRRSFEYIQDYINIQGLKILQEELSRIINYNVERECNTFIRNKIQDWQSTYQSSTIPIPIYQSPDPLSNNFIGRLAREINNYTDPKITIYLDLQRAWYDQKTHKQILNSQIFTKIREAIGPSGLIGLDKIYAYMFSADLKENIEKLQNNVISDQMWTEMFNNLTRELENKLYVETPSKFYLNYTSRWSKVWPKILDWVLEVGHKQILRQHIAYELNSSCRINAKNYESALNTFNKALLLELRDHQKDMTKPQPKNEILVELNPYLELSGLYDPLEQMFIITKNTHFISLFLFLFTISHVQKLKFTKNIDSLLGKTPKEQIDGNPMIIGILTILRQYHTNLTYLYLDYLCQYVNSFVATNLKAPKQEIGDVEVVIHFLEIFIRTACIPRNILEEKIPEIILNQFEYLAAKS